MPPRRPLPDLCLISVFKMLTPNEQLVASQMSPRCAVLVRAANRKVKTLVITSRDVRGVDPSRLKNKIDSFSLASKPSMQQLMDIPGETFPDYPMTTRLSKWNILQLEQLQLIDTATIEQIVTIFSAVTELKFIVSYSNQNNSLVSLLQHPTWQCQLTNLMVDGTYRMGSQLAGELIPAINGLTDLQLLALDWDNTSQIPDLSILAQLKTVVFKSYRLSAFLRSLERNAADNAHLEVHLISYDIEALFTLCQPLRSRIVRYQWDPLDYTYDQVPLLCSQFRFLTSLSFRNIESSKVGPLFSDLSQLPQLIHLKFGVDFSEVKEDEFPLPARPLVQLNSVRALELRLRTTSHSQIEWLNLPQTMPNLKTIHILEFICDSCKVQFGDYCTFSPHLIPSTIACFRASLFNLHPGVPQSRLILSSNYGLISAEKLLLYCQLASEDQSLFQFDHHPKQTMPPRRPPTDLDLISVFKMLTPNEQLVASKMSPRCAVLVRAANRRVKTLVMVTTHGFRKLLFLKNYINSYSFASNPSMQQLKDIPGEKIFPNYPMTTRLSEWNILRLGQLQLIDTATIEQIVTIFSAVTDLKFITFSSEHTGTLVSLLQHPNWQSQLTNLMVNRIVRTDSQLAGELITAINGLTALQLLALKWGNNTEVPDLSILAQLKTVVFESDNSNAFLRSLERNAADNAHLEVHLLSNDTKALLTLSQPLHSRIVRYHWSLLHYTDDQVPLLCSQFRSLTSLDIKGIELTNVGQLFSDLSQLHQLIHLNCVINFRKVTDEFPLPARPLAQLNSVRALELRLLIASHSQIEWLNLPGTMPNLKTIHSDFFRCDSCKVKFDGIHGDSSLLSSPPGLGCFRSSLFNLHPSVPLKRFILSSIYEFKSAEELLLQSRTFSVSGHHPKQTMPPRRPLPDLDLISVFKMLTPNEQLVASKMSPRCAVLVRAANRRVKTLVITAWNNGELHNLKYNINSFSLASKPSMQLLMDISGETFPDYPMATRLSKWNILRLDQLRLIDTATIEQIATIFSAVTDLKFITLGSRHIDTLVSLLQHPNWQSQLTNLMVGSYEIENPLAGELVPAINGLTALQQLAFDWDNDTKVPNLSILAQLKTVVFSSIRLSTFLRSLERNAADNADLEVHLISDDTEALLTLSQPLRSRIVCYGWDPLYYTDDQVPLLISQFRSLTSLTFWPIEPTEVGELFSDLSQLHQLIHLSFGVDFSEVKVEFPLPALPLVQLTSLRALELHLEITSHSQIEWLNLPKTMPNLKTIYIIYFSCVSCKLKFNSYRGDLSFLSSPPVLGCLRSSLFNLHPGVLLKRFILNSYEKPTSAEELLLQSQ
ncbi:hypothetical protein TYRP_015624 [Tyrophagus putrescentiae]|nr:hypothetical protein TYRP_015624 [Tyrophagus putrescentiae]